MTTVDGVCEAEHEALLSFMYMSPIGIIRSGLNGDVDMLNPVAVQLLMPVAGRMGVGNVFESLTNVAPELRNLVSSFSAERGRVCEGHRIVIAPSADRPTVLSCNIIKVNSSTLMMTLSDISRQVEAERRARQHESWLAGIYTSVNDFAFFTLDSAGRIDSWNGSVEQLTGFGADEVLGHTLDLFYAPETVDSYCSPEHISLTREEGWHIQERWCESREGRRYAAQILVAVLREDNGEIAGYSVVIRDVSERKISSDELTRLLTTDHLTGAVNRAHFFKLAEKELARARRLGKPLSCVMIDADHFKRINDTAGHQTGDLVLTQIVQKAKANLRSIDVLARLGGEEFCLMLPGTSSDEALVIAERVRATIADAKIDTGAGPVRVTVSAGIASVTDSTSSVNDLLAAADKALYAAKTAGRNRVELG
ncbi:diguanylate cyclase [Caballeronia sp. LZ062]|uniref:sensor domain-containing diguanylate cyclase n=1 Tax=unclassified Caballeronia TaxID=2646786 RepID=UPI002856DCFF|nr:MULTISPECIES: diguanylate cyclase [unclassified Caballeronia]MDR5857783.1 diguanylate cyclase [Caballeronia sp. LZ050]MDR5869333.1 diguanylate cyclase [Caballeronia sp. LZ062]